MKKGNNKKPRVVDVVRDVAVPFCHENGLIFEDVEFVKEGPHRYLRVVIDRVGGVGLEDCQNVSRFLNKKLDSIDPIEENYFLEVTSPGLERELKKDGDFARFTGSKVQANLFNPYNGAKVIKGKLMGLISGEVRIETENFGTVDIPRDKIALIKLMVDYSNIPDEVEGEFYEGLDDIEDDKA